MPQLLRVEDGLDYLSNRIIPDTAIRERCGAPSAFMGTAGTTEFLPPRPPKALDLRRPSTRGLWKVGDSRCRSAATNHPVPQPNRRDRA